jgi:radical SAM superfamily enzyme YgiQ (UPF0313 family)
MYQVILLTDVFGNIRTKPLGPYVIANNLRQQGYSVLVIDMISNFAAADLKYILDKVVSNDTIFLGWSLSIFFDGILTAFGLQNLKELNSYYKKLYPKLNVIAGGAQIKNLSYVMKLTKESFEIDYIMLGYGESMILDVIKQIENKKPVKFSDIINKVTKVIDYDIKASGHDFKFTNHKWCKDDVILDKEPLPIEIARGCIFKCKFCSYPMLGKKKNDLSYLRDENTILSEILFNYDNFKTTDYVVIDDTFNERTDKLELLLRIRDKSKLDLSFTGYNRLDLVYAFPQQIKLFKDLNWLSFSFGIETFNLTSAKIIGKGFARDKALDTMVKIKNEFNNKVHIQNNFIIGLPFDTPNTVENWTNVIFQNDYPADVVNFYPLALSDSYEPSSFFENIEKYNYRRDNNRPYAWYSDDWSFDEVFTIANRYNSILQHRNKLPCFKLTGAMKLGFTRDEVILTQRRLLEQRIETEQLDKKYFESYKTKLINTINNKS